MLFSHGHCLLSVSSRVFSRVSFCFDLEFHIELQLILKPRAAFDYARAEISAGFSALYSALQSTQFLDLPSVGSSD